MDFFVKIVNGLKAVNCFRKNLHHRCLEVPDDIIARNFPTLASYVVVDIYFCYFWHFFVVSLNCGM